MTPAEVLEVGREAIIVLIQISGPVMTIGLVVGLAVSLFQSVTQLQEMTLTFVPKILAVFVSIMVLLPFMINTLSDFMQSIAQRIIGSA